MEININDHKKMVDIWLTNAEKGDPEIQAMLKELFGQYKEQKYLVAVFESGERDLYHNTLDLLIYNKRRSAQLAVQREKRRQTPSTEKALTNYV